MELDVLIQDGSNLAVRMAFW